MFKSIVLLSLAVICSAADYYEMAIDHSLPTPADYEKASQGSDGYQYRPVETESAVNRRGYVLPTPQGSDQYESKSENYESLAAPYGYEQPKYERKKVYAQPSYGDEEYGQSQSYGQSYGQSSYGGNDGGYGGQSQGYGGQSQGYGGQSHGYSAPREYVQKSYSSPIHAERRVEIKPIMTQSYDSKDHLIDVKDDTPIVIHFRTHANRIKVEQTRIPDKPKEVEHTRSEDEPHRVVHEVYKPVIQEVREIIQPFRKVVQQVQPVVEEVQTVVHRADGRRGGGGNSGGNGGGEYGQRSQGKAYSKRSTAGNKKYNTNKEYLPEGSVMAIRGVPVYRSVYKGPAAAAAEAY